MPTIQGTFLKIFKTNCDLQVNYEWTKNELWVNDEWIMIKLQVMLTMVILVNIGVHNANLEKWSL
jgi:uncharacterized membrane protein YiaA